MRHPMSHLSSGELVDALGPTAAARVTAHLAACDRCRRALAELAATLEAVKRVEAPEPSPLFWSHFAARVGRAIGPEPQARVVEHAPRFWPARWTLTLGATSVVVLAIAGAVVLGPGRAPRPEAEPAAAVASHPESDRATVDADAPWAFIRDAGDDMDWDVISAAMLDSEPGSAEREVLQLSDAERGELARLLQLELSGSSL